MFKLSVISDEVSQDFERVATVSYTHLTLPTTERV